MSAKRKQPQKGSKPRPTPKAKSAAKSAAKATRARPTTQGASKSATKGAARAKPAGAKPDQMPKEVLEFIQAIDTYKRQNQRPFPNWSEILEILKELGYQKSLT